MSGSVTKIVGQVITLDDGSTHQVAPDAKVTLNGKPAKLADLKQHDSVALTGGPPVAGVAASR